MADLFRSFLDFRPFHTSYKLHVVSPSKHLSSTLVYSPSSRIRKINRRPFHLKLFSRPSATTPSVDVVSTHEHSDGSLVFRFGEPGEAASSVQTEEPNVEKKEIEVEGIEDDLVVNILNDTNDGGVKDSSLAEVTDESNSIVIDSKNLDEKMQSATEFELHTTVSNIDLKDSSTQGIDMEDTGENEEYLDDEQENSSMKSVSPNFDVISTHEHSDGSLVFRFGDLSEAASNAQLEESKVEEEIEEEGTEEDRMVTDLNGDDGGVRDSNLAELTDESTSLDFDDKKLIISEEENDLGNDIESDGKDEECLNEERDSSSLMNVPMLANSSKIESSIAAVETPENNIVDITMLQTISLSPDTLTESENDAFQASIYTVVSTESSADSKIDGGVNNIVTVASGMEAALQFSIDAGAQISLEGNESRNEIAEDGSESGIIQLMSKSPQMETGSEVTDESNFIIIDEKNLSISEKESDLGEKLKDANEFELPTIVSKVELKNSSTPGNDIKSDGKDEECLNDEGDSSSLMSVPMLENSSKIENDTAAVETPEKNIVDVTMLQTISLSSDTLTESEKDSFFQDSIDSVVSTELSSDSKIDEDANNIVTLAPGMEAALQLSMDAEAQTSLEGNEFRNEIAEDGNESGIIQLMPMSPQLETGQTIDEESVSDDGEECRDTDKAESLKLLDDIPQKSVLVSESTEDDDTVNGDIVESSGNHVVEMEPTEVAIKSQEIQVTDFVLSSGAALLPHPSKVLTGGEDAYFVSGQTWLGIADGVGQWSFEGTNPGLYAQELMKNCEKRALDCNSNSLCNPAELLILSVGETQSPGSSTVLLAQLVGQVLQVANIGDSGFIILRHGSIYKRSSPMLHVFHFPLRIERGDDPSNLAELYKIDLEEEDVIILASDGLLDNLYDQEIALEVSKHLAADSKPKEIAEALAAKAQEVGKSATARSPFADNAHAAGYAGYTGGKLDDVTVVVSVVQRQSSSQTL
ncbi:uncharacterized protein [Henckelia pumila]|uniref:uncharacterized protein isoform X2 n=1 Tax=Henckelia pumila TaxID=405737 RepID=UPI003C6E243B